MHGDTLELLKAYIAPNVLDPKSPWTKSDFTVTLFIAIALLPVRAASEAVWLPVIRQFLKRNSSSSKDVKALKKATFAVFDNLWISTFSLALGTLAWYATLTANDGCLPWDTRSCFADFDNQAYHQPQRWFMLSMFGYYLYEVLGSMLRVGTRLKADMWAHHVVTLSLIAIGYLVGFHRMSVMWQALFDVSNPLLHAAKALHVSGVKSLEGAKMLCFHAFAVVFFVCRVVGGPVSILYPSVTQAIGVLPPSWIATCLALEVFIVGIQYLWFYKILQMARNPASAKED